LNSNIDKLFSRKLLRSYQEKAAAIAKSCSDEDEFWERIETLAHEMMWESQLRTSTFEHHHALINRLAVVLYCWVSPA
jgi:hypothetical protein